ncbi:hypothetical protein RhiirA1_428600, partial [Rhizophagus irregularis]
MVLNQQQQRSGTTVWEHVEDIFNENISQLTKSTKVKEKLDAIERVTLSFPLSNLNSWKKITRPSYKILTWKKR